MSMKYAALTAKQKKVYSAIENYVKLKGIPPTVREIGEMLGEKTPGAVQGILNRLEQKGVLRRQVGMARSIQLIADDESLYETPCFVPFIKKISRRNFVDLLNMYNIKKYVPLSPTLFQEGKQYFIIDCSDDSLSESGIKPGDYLIAQITDEIEPAGIYLILYENVVLMRRYIGETEDGHIELYADNEYLEKNIIEKSELQFVAKIVGKYSKV